jgi:hypothetical protein
MRHPSPLTFSTSVTENAVLMFKRFCKKSSNSKALALLDSQTKITNSKQVIVVEPGMTDLEFGQAITLQQYRSNCKKFSSDAFTVVPFHPLTQLQILLANDLICESNFKF